MSHSYYGQKKLKKLRHQESVQLHPLALIALVVVAEEGTTGHVVRDHAMTTVVALKSLVRDVALKYVVLKVVAAKAVVMMSAKIFVATDAKRIMIVTSEVTEETEALELRALKKDRAATGKTPLILIYQDLCA
jgi:hypothetical protein